MYYTPLFITLKFGKTFIIECHALGQGIGIVLTQFGRPLDFEI